MMKFISGCIVGAAVGGLAVFLTLPPCGRVGAPGTAQSPAGTNKPAEPVGNSPYSAGDKPPLLAEHWSFVGSSPRLMHEEFWAIDDPRLLPYPPDDTPIVSLSAVTQLGSASRRDIRRVCILPFFDGIPVEEQASATPNGFAIQVWLTDDARHKLGADQLAHPGAVGTFDYLGIPVARFQTNAAHVEDFIGDSGDFAGEPDFLFYGSPANAAHALVFAKGMTGENRVEPCEAGHDPARVPGYSAHLPIWQKWVEKYPEHLELWKKWDQETKDRQNSQN